VLLSRHPEIARKVRAEADAVLAGGRAPTFEDVTRLSYTRMVLEEVLRLYPPLWMLVRDTMADDAIGGYDVPRGTVIAISPWVVHRLPRLWNNPEGFDPERFTPEAAEQRHKFAHLPFGGGPRTCIGSNFALMEAQLVVAMTIQRCALDLAPSRPIEPEALITLRAKPAVEMTVTFR
jgi:cytochrome P450